MFIAAPLIFYARKTYTLFARPLLKILPPHSQLIATDITSPFMVPLKLALWLAFLIILPFILLQIWGFITPALYQQEKKLLKTTLYFSTLLFYSGLIFAYYCVCPMTFRFFANMTPDGVLMLTDIGHYLDFVFKLMLAFGGAFQMPVILVFLIYKGFISIDTLKAKRAHMILGSFIVGMLLTPPDVVAQILLALPLWGLFELSLFIGQLLVAPKLIHDDVP